jgi:hypothetical protein
MLGSIPLPLNQVKCQLQRAYRKLRRGEGAGARTGSVT